MPSNYQHWTIKTQRPEAAINSQHNAVGDMQKKPPPINAKPVPLVISLSSRENTSNHNSTWSPANRTNHTHQTKANHPSRDTFPQGTNRMAEEFEKGS